MDTELHQEKDEKRRRREQIIIGVTAVALVLLTYLWARISELSSKIPVPNNILVFGFININIILLVLFLFLTSRNVIKLMSERKKRVIWSKLRSRLVIAFLSFSFIPTIVLFLVATTFITKSIDSWFSDEIESSLKESLEVARSYYQSTSGSAINYATLIGEGIQGRDLFRGGHEGSLKEFIHQKQKEYNLGVVEVFSREQKELVTTLNPTIPVGSFTSPDSDFVREGLEGKTLSRIQSVEAGDIIRGIVPVYSPEDDRQIEGVVVVNHFVDKSLVGKMAEIQQAYNDYRESEVLKAPLKISYVIFLLMIALLIIFSATWVGLYLARGITVPIQNLAEGTRQIAQGNLEVHIDAVADDEIGSLVHSFNKMARDLSQSKLKEEEANQGLQVSNEELDKRRRYMEIVLKNVAAGVISLDKEGIITTINKSAERMLGLRAEKLLGKEYTQVLPPQYLELVQGILNDLGRSRRDSIKKQVKLSLEDRTLTLFISLNVLRDEKEQQIGMVVVFDDLTQLLKAQRAAAWREVAKRIAHEIKNPLTPIQLSAQRLRRGRLAESRVPDGILEDCTSTIIKQVEELKTLVNEFSNFARMPAAEPAPNNLNDIISETLVLYQEAHKNIEFSFNRSDGLPILEIDRDQIKRMLINLLENAVASIEGAGEVRVETVYDDMLGVARITISDNGCGIPPEDKPRLFEPYFSTKKSGTGLGLAIVSRIVSDHNGYIRVQDNEPRGTRFVVELPAPVEGVRVAAS
ncbi:MAG: HAMP domain-containing protein [Deltaproteobacteria bacterium]|nr:MAG: HAMP domain-containing protein [Deltaproteobacteria bacterium]